MAVSSFINYIEGDSRFTATTSVYVISSNLMYILDFLKNKQNA